MERCFLDCSFIGFGIFFIFLGDRRFFSSKFVFKFIWFRMLCRLLLVMGIFIVMIRVLKFSDFIFWISCLFSCRSRCI